MLVNVNHAEEQKSMDSRSFKDIFLEVLNKKRVKLDLEFKYILTLVNYTKSTNKSYWFLFKHADIDDIIKTADFKTYIAKEKQRTRECNLFSLEGEQQGSSRVIAKVSDVAEVDAEVIEVVQLVKERIKSLRKMSRAKSEIQNFASD